MISVIGRTTITKVEVILTVILITVVTEIQRRNSIQ